MLLVAIRVKNISPARWQTILGLLVGLQTGYAVFMVCDRGEKYFVRTLGCALGGRAIKYRVDVGDRLTMRQPSAQGL